MSWTQVYADDFSGGTAELHGSVGTGGGTWDVNGGAGTHARSGGNLGSSAGSWGNVPAVISEMDLATTDQAVEVTWRTGAGWCGLVVRWNATNHYYYLIYASGALHLRVSTGGGYPGSTLASWSVTLADGDLVRLEAVGSTFEAFVNGSSIGSTTDTTHPAGRCGVWLAFGETLDEFKAYVAAASSAARRLVDGGLVGRGLVNGGLIG